MLLTNGVHEAAVHIGVEQVRHGQHRAVPQRCQSSRHATFPPCHLLAVFLNLAAVIQQVHEQSEVSKGEREEMTAQKTDLKEAILNPLPNLFFTFFTLLQQHNRSSLKDKTKELNE